MIIALLFFAIQQQQSNTKVAQVWQTLQSRTPSTDRFTPAMVADQPEPVQIRFPRKWAQVGGLAAIVTLNFSG